MTEFEKKVYRAILKIPIGETRSYEWVARKAGHPGANRAVGQALKKNPFPLVIPCHRVVRSSGCLGGYSWGGERVKKKLLDLERHIRDNML